MAWVEQQGASGNYVSHGGASGTYIEQQGASGVWKAIGGVISGVVLAFQADAFQANAFQMEITGDLWRVEEAGTGTFVKQGDI